MGHGDGPWGAVKGFVHAHVGWMFSNLGMEQGREYGRDLYEDRLVRTIDRLYLLWVGLSLGLPFAIGYLVGGTLEAGLAGLVWGGLVRIFAYQHATFAVNSICHMFGRRHFRSRDESRNNWLIAVLVFGEGWHNNHHAFPSSARHGLARWQVDVSWLVIRTLERLGLVWNVRRPTPEQRSGGGSASAGRGMTRTRRERLGPALDVGPEALHLLAGRPAHRAAQERRHEAHGQRLRMERPVEGHGRRPPRGSRSMSRSKSAAFQPPRTARRRSGSSAVTSSARTISRPRQAITSWIRVPTGGPSETWRNSRRAGRHRGVRPQVGQDRPHVRGRGLDELALGDPHRSLLPAGRVTAIRVPRRSRISRT